MKVCNDRTKVKDLNLILVILIIEERLLVAVDWALTSAFAKNNIELTFNMLRSVTVASVVLDGSFLNQAEYLQSLVFFLEGTYSSTRSLRV